ncbi:MAG: DNA mismatch repair endonuclease MutL [Bacillota bacterium]|nr:DNA mismatch repair endonuclease MutL [Bacillota bacterium]
MSIAVLSESVINQIAAGEVIERPASVVKELVENALDAGAHRIQVAVERGGIGLVRVTDDGEGIAPGEVELAFARHATSKLRRVEDLWAIRTLGFRGEALPSIAAVARVTLTTRQPGEPLGRRVEVTGGTLERVQDWGAPAGTTVEVRDLFFNTPARRKFLKSESAEAARIAALLTGLAVVHPGVAFSLVSDGRTVLTTTGAGDLRETLAALLGPGAVENLLPIAGEGAGITVSGYAGSAGLTWANRSWELFSVNGRLVEARLLQAATEKAYAGLLPLRRFPVAFLQLTADPGLVDVNVHPAKREVRFRREGELFQVVQRAVAAALERQPLYRPAGPAVSGPPAPRVAEALLPLAEARDGEGPAGPGTTDRPAPESPAAPSRQPLRFLGQLAASYLVGETAEGLVLVDQHAAHERVIFDTLRAGLLAGTPLPVQTLLWPTQVELSPAEAELLTDFLPLLASLGFAVEPFGGRSILLRAVPVLLTGIDLRQVLADLVEEAETSPSSARRAPTALAERLLQRLACRAAVKANQSLSPEEAGALLEQWQTSAQPWTCPHGRPVALRWTLAEIAASFLRR